eukprot:TRINITY_DN2199_c0_g1_i1.p1 TRINITY_DN2199_c0_g1~~TRINITY_DN2199_c0_g1_i1.p1  ORF type:complete len:320 (-),score=15.48 TRINITY_DN2199_c0_g1_i1:223-1047(-)
MVKIRENTYFLLHDKTPLMILARIVFFYFANGINAAATARSLGKECGYKIERKTVGRIYHEMRIKIMSYYDILWSSTKIGFPNDIEIDESLFAHLTLLIDEEDKEREELKQEEEEKIMRERHKEKRRLQKWAIGMYERNTGAVRIFTVEKRDAKTINRLCLDNIVSETRIWSDLWKGYLQLEDIGFQHSTINHSISYGYGEKTTNRIESVWSQLKDFAKIYSKAIPASNCQEFLTELLFRREKASMAQRLAFIMGAGYQLRQLLTNFKTMKASS